MSWVWPFTDARAFWDWAMDPDAKLDSQDEDLLLHDIAGIDFLIAAADLPACPKQEYCALIIEDLAREVIHSPRSDDIRYLAAAAERAGRGHHALVRQWAAYAHRLIGYRRHSGQVNRAAAAAMATDLFSGPIMQQRRDDRSWLSVTTVEKGRLWQCTERSGPHYLYINRRTGAWMTRYRQPATPEQLSDL